MRKANKEEWIATIVSLVCLALVIFSFGVSTVRADDNDIAKAKYAICAACHGVNGEGGIGPKLSGQSVESIVDKLRSYKAGEKIGPQSALMWGQAAMLTEDDIEKLAVYIGALE